MALTQYRPHGALAGVRYEAFDSVGGSQTVSPIAGAFRFTGYAPTVSVVAGGNQTIAPTAGALRFTGYAPTISASSESGGGRRKRKPLLMDSPYTHEDYVQWVTRTVAVVVASGALDA